MGQTFSECGWFPPNVDPTLLKPTSQPANAEKRWDLKRLRAFILAGKLAPFL